MRKVFVWLCLSCVSLVCCLQNNSSSVLQDRTKDSLIVFYHYKDTSRSEFAESLRKIGSLGPKVIALEVIFDELKSPMEDSILSSTLSGLDNVILAADLTSPGSVVGRSHEYLRNQIDEGLISYMVEPDGTTDKYIQLFQNRDGQMIAFPDEIVFNYRPETNYRFLNMEVNEPMPIHFTKELSNFYVIDKNNLSAELVQDKIVIVGDLEPGDDYFIVPFGEQRRKTFSLVVTANIILNILSEHDEKRQTLR